MTRQNVTDGVREIMTKHVPGVRRRGRRQVRGDDRDRVRAAPARHGRRGRRRRRPRPTCVRLNPRVTAWFTADGARELHALEAETGTLLPLRGLRGPAARPLRGRRWRARARRSRSTPCPFRAGEEVHVDIVEPHMYNDGRRGRQGRRLPDRRSPTAIAFVGEKKLVRIEEAGRTTATRGADRRRRRARPRRPRPSAPRAREQADQRARRSRRRQEGRGQAQGARGGRAARGGRRRSRRSPTTTSRGEAGTGPRRPRRRRRRTPPSRAPSAAARRRSRRRKPAGEDGAERGGCRGGRAATSAADGRPTRGGRRAGERRRRAILEPRRRGRRGGRRRSRAKAEADAEVSEPASDLNDHVLRSHQDRR